MGAPGPGAKNVGDHCKGQGNSNILDYLVITQKLGYISGLESDMNIYC